MPADGGAALLETGQAPAGDDETARLDRVITVPNLISLGRLVLVAVFLFLLFGRHERVAAVVVLAAAGASDFLDGYVARRFAQVSTLGKVLDPAADRVVLGSAVIAIAIFGAVPGWVAGVVLGREVVVSLAVLALAAAGAGRIDVLFAGKAGTFGLMCCFPLLLLADAHAGWATDLREVTWGLLGVSLALSFVATACYVPQARTALAARRSLEAGGAVTR